MVELAFTNPGSLWLLILVPLAVVLHFVSIWYTKKRALRFANFEVLERATEQKQGVPLNLQVMLTRALVVTSLVFAVSGATLIYQGNASSSDYVIAIDASYSMLADDLKPNRLEAAKTSALALVNSIPTDAKIGVVSFGGATAINLKPTDQLDNVRDALRALNFSEVGGTAIGQAVVTSTDLLADSKRSKTIVLLTDGQNNFGIDLPEAADYARASHVTVFTIGAGTPEGGRIQEIGLPATIDEEGIRDLAESTGGKYFRTKDAAGLQAVFTQIALSSNRVIALDLRLWLVLLAALLLFFEWWLANIRFTRIEWKT